MKSNDHVQQIDDQTLDSVERCLVALQQAIAAIVTPLTPKKRQTLPKMGEKTLAFVKKCHEFAQNNPEFCPKYFDMDAFTADYHDAHGLYSSVNIAAQVLQNLTDTQMCAGSEAFQAALVFYHHTKVASANGVPGAKAVYEELRKRFPNRSRKARRGERNPPRYGD